MPKLLDVTLVKKTFTYNEETGVLSLLIDRGRHGMYKKGTAVGTLHKTKSNNTVKSYLRLSFDGAYVYAHRIIWVLMTGVQPECIDHIDGDGLNNKWSNLRSVSQRVNGKNQKLHVTNTSGASGLTYRKDSGKWRARIMVDGKNISLGTFVNKEDAIQARKTAEKQYEFHER